jgi:D-alanyl-D-alanine carboxypeptidase
MQLIQEHRLDIDAPIWKFLSDEPWFSRLPNAREITIRHLMTHTSGIVRYEFQEPFLAELTANPMRTWTPADRLAYVLDLTPPFAAGQGWEYSDTNYIVLGVIIERVTGKPYYSELRRRILVPLGLTNTVPADAPLVPGLAQGYAGAANAFGGHDAMVDSTGHMTINPQMEWTGGGIASTADDLARWAKLTYEGRAFDRSLVPRMIAAAVPAKLGPDTKYGLGVIVRQTPLGEAWGHSGFFPGYQAEVLYFPASRVAVAFQVNSSVPRATGASPTRIAIELAKAAGAGTP